MAGIPADMIDLQLLAEAVGRNGAPVRRRDLLALAAQLGATAVLDPDIWERLSHALTRPGTVDEALVREMEARSAGFYLLEEIVPAQAVLKVLTAHLREVSSASSRRSAASAAPRQPPSPGAPTLMRPGTTRPSSPGSATRCTAPRLAGPGNPASAWPG